MSKFNVYTLYDIKAEEAGPPFVALTDEVAVRNICLTLKDTLYPEDYKLMHIGIYDSHTMSLCECGVYREIDFSLDFKAFQRRLADYNMTMNGQLFHDRKTLRPIDGGKKDE